MPIKNKSKRNKNKRDRIKKDPAFRFKEYVSAEFRKLLKRNRNSVLLKYLPYTINQLKNHIEKQFEPWMSWSNHGRYSAQNHTDNPTWQLDHIIPQSDLPYTSFRDKNFKKCWSLENLRPLCSKQNLIEGVQRIRHKK